MTDEPNHPSPITHRPSPIPVIALDGPSGSGKGAVGQIIARRLGWHYLDSGALYRVVALAANRGGLDVDRQMPEIVRQAQILNIRFVPRIDASADMLLDGVAVGDAVRSEEVGRDASRLAVIPEVRHALLDKQRALRQPPGLVADGRDMGSTVFPDAFLKVFVTASPDVRAERRYKQLKNKGFDVNLPRLLKDIRERDERDAARLVSPLKPAEGAHIVDTSQLDIQEVVKRVLQLFQDQRQ
jgi:cytidylate kinase